MEEMGMHAEGGVYDTIVIGVGGMGSTIC